MKVDPLSSARIVCVGLRETDQRTLETHLRGAGLTDVSVALPAHAAERTVAGAVDLLIVDVMQTSSDVLAVMRAAAPGPGSSERVPVIVTGPINATDRVQACLQRGAEDFMTTPFDAANALLVSRRVEFCLRRQTRRGLPVQITASTDDPDETAVMEVSSDSSSRFVPREFLVNLERKSLADVRLGDHVKRDMTVFFSDIRDFTALSEQLTPQQNFDFLNSYLQTVTPIIRAHAGFIDKYIGDAIMALFPRAAHDAIDAAVHLQQEVVRYNAGREAAGYDPIRIGIGMHRGELILGTIGEEERMQTTVIADAVNVASRIEGLTKTFGVNLLVSGTVVDGLAPNHGFRLRHLGAVKAKGKTQSVEIYECYDNDTAEQIAHKQKTTEAFVTAIDEFRKGMFLTAGRIFARIAELAPDDVVAAYYRDRCSLTAVRGRGAGPWDGAERIEVK